MNLRHIMLQAEMPYSRAVLLELLRYTTVGALGLPHETVVDTKVAGYTIPKGTFVRLCLHLSIIQHCVGSIDHERRFREISRDWWTPDELWPKR